MIEAEKATDPIKRMCELLEVSRSGFYLWRARRDRGPTPSQQRRAELDAKVAASHAASDGVYGAPRVLADLRADGERVSRKTVVPAFRRQGLAGISPRTFAPHVPDPAFDTGFPAELQHFARLFQCPLRTTLHVRRYELERDGVEGHEVLLIRRLLPSPGQVDHGTDRTPPGASPYR